MAAPSREPARDDPARPVWRRPRRPTSPRARRTSARPGWGSHPTRCAARRASSAPSMSPLRSRIRPSSLSGHPISRRRYGLSSSQAASASRSASSHAPRNLRISARCTRQRPCRLPMAFVLHHRSIASVHSSARSYCASPCRAQTSSQYTSPVESGSRSPETAATPTSSSSARPSSTSPSRMRSRAAATRPTAHAAGSHSEPTAMARSDHCRAPWRSPVSIRSYVRTTASHACAGVSSWPSRRRSARASQPRTGAISAVSRSRCNATRTAAPAAATGSPACTPSACARSHASMVTSRWPAA